MFQCFKMAKSGTKPGNSKFYADQGQNVQAGQDHNEVDLLQSKIEGTSISGEVEKRGGKVLIYSAKDTPEKEHCVICMDDMTNPTALPCKHSFCKACLDTYKIKCQPKCPSCGKAFGEIKGDQPPGTMIHTMKPSQHLNGFPNCGTIEITYSFANGIQQANHPNPGQPYRGTQRIAYLPANNEGREVLGLLDRAFKNRLLFTIGRSITTGCDNVVIWNDVHHKTTLTGQYGYPDSTYLSRVKEELAAKGILP